MAATCLPFCSKAVNVPVAELLKYHGQNVRKDEEPDFGRFKSGITNGNCYS